MRQKHYITLKWRFGEQFWGTKKQNTNICTARGQERHLERCLMSMQKGDNLAGTVRTEGPGASWIPHGADDVSVPRVLAAAPRRRLAADHVLRWPPRDRRAFVSCHQKCGCRWLAPHLQDLSPNSETTGRRLAPMGRQHQITGVWRWEDGGGFDV